MEQLLAILSSIKPGVDFANAGRLVDDHVLDSFDIVALVGELNDAFDVDITMDVLEPENFNSPEAIMDLIATLK